MILALDIGNTNIVIGCLKSASDIVFVERISTNHQKTSAEYAVQIKALLELTDFCADQLKGVVISSVVPPITERVKEALMRITGLSALVVGPGVKNGLHIQIDNPAQLGSDLVVDAVAACALYPCPLMIVDMGTATTISVLDEQKSYIGGMILPGIDSSLEALVHRTSQLPKINLEPPRRMIGKNTIECMKSGIIHGSAACIDGMIERIEAELGRSVTVILTGGRASSIAPHCRHRAIVDDTLLLKGLYFIYEKNQSV